MTQIQRFKSARDDFVVSYADELREKYPQDFNQLLGGQNDLNDMKNISKKSKKMSKVVSKNTENEGEMNSPGKTKKSRKKSFYKKGRVDEQELED